MQLVGPKLPLVYATHKSLCPQKQKGSCVYIKQVNEQVNAYLYLPFEGGGANIH